jgi:hypothetical protein
MSHLPSPGEQFAFLFPKFPLFNIPDTGKLTLEN